MLPHGRDAHAHRPRSEAELARYGYSGQGFPLYGRAAPERTEEPSAEPGADWARREPGGFGIWSGAFAQGYTTSLHPQRRRAGSPGWADARAGSQYGKGPRGYARSDARLYEDVCDRLSEDDALDASDISVRVSAGEVTLEGSVPDRESKRRAVQLACEVRGVRDVHSDLKTRKGLLRDLAGQLDGTAEREHHGHHGSGTRA